LIGFAAGARMRSAAVRSMMPAPEQVVSRRRWLGLAVKQRATRVPRGSLRRIFSRGRAVFLHAGARPLKAVGTDKGQSAMSGPRKDRPFPRTFVGRDGKDLASFRSIQEFRRRTNQFANPSATKYGGTAGNLAPSRNACSREISRRRYRGRRSTSSDRCRSMSRSTTNTYTSGTAIFLFSRSDDVNGRFCSAPDI